MRFVAFWDIRSRIARGVLFSILVVMLMTTLGACSNPFGLWSFGRTFETQSDDDDPQEDPPQEDPPPEEPLETIGPDIFFTDAGGDHEFYLAAPGGGYVSGTVADSGCAAVQRGAVLFHSNGDAFLDVLVLCGSDSHLVFPGDGEGSFGAPTTIPSTGYVAYDAAVANLDQSGGADIVLACNGSNAILHNVAEGSGTVTTLPEPSSESTSVVTADFDLDGDTDIFVTNRGSGCVLYSNNTPSLWGYQIYSGTAQNTDAAVGDFDGDDIPDVFVTVDGGYNEIYRSQGAIGFNEIDSVSLDDSASRAVAVGDFTEDGNLDAYVANFAGPNRLYIGDGNGSFSAVSISNGTVNPSYSVDVAVADMDGDGHLDVVLASDGGRNQIHYGDGTGDFPRVVDLSTVARSTVAVAIGETGAE